MLKKPIPIKINFQNIRIERQNLNNLLVYNSIINNDTNKFNDTINIKELERVLLETGLTLPDLLNKCKTDIILCKIMAGRISKNASRQGTGDETYQLDICNSIAKKCGINIENLTTTSFRPTKDGLIVSQDYMKKNNIKKDTCLKSFDGKINGKINGWIFAKVVFGNGGHQDNVFEEADCLCEWVSKYKQETDELFTILIDTDLSHKLEIIKNKYTNNKNILIVNHFELQELFIQKYYDDDNI